MIEDNLYKFLKYYSKSPQWVKSISGRFYRMLPLSLRYGKVYTEYAKLLEKSQWWPKEKLEEYQWRKLDTLLKHAYENVPYYRRIFNERGIKPKDIQNFDDFRKIPFLNRETVINHRDELVAINYPKSKLLYMTTGGTMGRPIGMYYLKGVERSRELAFMTSLWSRVGYKIGDKLIVLRGNVIPSSSKGIYWEYEPIKNRLILSVYHMTEENLPLYIEQIGKFQPKFIHTYPSAITILARFMRENSIEPFSSVKAILCSSEAFYPGQRKLIEDAFRCRVFSWYGHGEVTTLAGECEYSKDYHIFSEYGFTELIDVEGEVINRGRILGEIVGTGFESWAMPFIRYRTEDFAEYSDKKCECGRKYRLLKRVEGRWLQEMIVTRKENLISITALNMHSNVFDNVKQFQFYQDKKGEVIFNIICRDSYTERNTRYIRKELLKKLGNDVDLQIRFVDKIPRTKSGKYRFLIQKLPIKFGDEQCYS